MNHMQFEQLPSQKSSILVFKIKKKHTKFVHVCLHLQPKMSTKIRERLIGGTMFIDKQFQVILITGRV